MDVVGSHPASDSHFSVALSPVARPVSVYSLHYAPKGSGLYPQYNKSEEHLISAIQWALITQQPRSVPRD